MVLWIFRQSAFVNCVTRSFLRRTGRFVVNLLLPVGGSIIGGMKAKRAQGAIYCAIELNLTAIPQAHIGCLVQILVSCRTASDN